MNAQKPQEMQFAGFQSTDAAKAHRAQHGGWIFVSEEGGPTWFAPAFTPSAIFSHHVTKGLSGKLI